MEKTTEATGTVRFEWRQTSARAVTCWAKMGNVSLCSAWYEVDATGVAIGAWCESGPPEHKQHAQYALDSNDHAKRWCEQQLKNRLQIADTGA